MGIDINDIAAEFDLQAQAYDAQHRDQPRKARSTQMSQVGHSCARYLTLLRIAGEKATPFSVDTLRIFQRGRTVEAWAKSFLMELWPGRVVQLEPVVDIPELGMSGRMDVGWRSGPNPRDPILPVEIKSTESFDSMVDMKSVLRNRFGDKWIYQAVSYAMATNVDASLLMVVDPGKFDYRFIPVPRDPEIERTIRQRASDVEASIRSIYALTGGKMELGEQADALLPPYCPDPLVCIECRLAHVCNPPLSFKKSLEFFESSELETDIRRLVELKPAKAEHDRIDGRVKKSLAILHQQNPAVTDLMIGNVTVHGDFRHRNGYSVEPTDFWEHKYEVVK